jgi:hypothetical protein
VGKKTLSRTARSWSVQTPSWWGDSKGCSLDRTYIAMNLNTHGNAIPTSPHHPPQPQSSLVKWYACMPDACSRQFGLVVVQALWLLRCQPKSKATGFSKSAEKMSSMRWTK